MKAPSTDARKPIAQDLTGHVTFNSEQSRAFLHSVEKDGKINAARKYGLLQHKPSRNPLRAEATPRVDYKGFDYNPPPAPEVKERWVYPETDWGLMLKFASQKQIYQELEEQAKRCDEKIKEFRSKQESKSMDSSRKLQEEEEGAQMTSRSQLSARKETGRMSTARDSETALLPTLMEEKVETSRQKTVRTSRQDAVHPTVATLKALRENANHPEILEKFRAQRAAEFVKKQKHPLEPPTSRDLPSLDFKPGGGSVNLEAITEKRRVRQEELQTMKKQPKKPIANQEPVSTARLKEQLGTLVEQLKKTDNELSMQDLKIALNTKTHNYERKR